MSKVDVLVGGKTKVSLTQNEYKAQGGQGTVYVKGGLAYKIYHDPGKMIPEAKIRELASINIPTVLGPKDILYDATTKTPVGFTMPFVTDTEYLTKMFSRNFKDTNGIDNDKIVKLVTEMQNVLGNLHTQKIIVGDYNEMNFLVDGTFTIPYHIDVDSYQTRSFPCTAIMDTVRDRRLPFGQFDELSDWFSWGVVTFQMYCGIHPFMGRHPKFKTTELDERMKQNISVFDPDVKIPKACQDFSVIPRNHLEWYKKVFMDGYRSPPPIAGAFGYVPGFNPIMVTGSGVFVVDLVHDYGERIIEVRYYGGTRYVVTDKRIYKKESDIFEFTSTPKNVRLLNVVGNEPIISVVTGDQVRFFNISREQIGQIGCEASMVSDGIMYTVVSGRLIENNFIQLAKLTHTTKIVDNITPVFKMFDGLVVQDVFGKRRLSIPYKPGVCASVMVDELTGYRVIDATRQGQFAVFITEKNGVYDRLIMYFDKDFKSYEAKIDADIKYKSLNAVVRQNGMLVSVIEDDTLELMMDIKRGEKRITDCPAELTMPLVDGLDRIMFISGTKLFSLKMS